MLLMLNSLVTQEMFTQEDKKVSIWVVPAEAITASSPKDSEALFDPANDKVYRHPIFFVLPDELTTCKLSQ